MATVSGSRPGAGGKIVTNRRRQRLALTPYDRPPVPPPPPQSPNWFTGVIIPSARSLASSAGKILSSVIFSDSGSSSSEDVDSASEDDVDFVNDYESPNDGINASNEFSVQITETKRLIEQLILQENFSREECDRLVKVLNSRVMDQSIEAGEKRSLANSPRLTVDHEDVDVFNKAVLEAQKWFQEKKERSSSVVELAHGTSNFKSTAFDHIESGVGSPVDMARSYMRNKPPWASPSPTIRTPSTTTMNLFKEGTPYPISHDVLSSSKRRDSLATGSWNIQEELRKVRSKAIDNMLRSPPSKIDSSVFTVASTREETAGTSKVVSDVGEIIPEQHSSWKPKPVDTLMDVGMSFDPALVALESRQDGQATEALTSIPDASVSGNNEDSEAIQIDGKDTPSKSLYPTSPDHAGEQHSDPHSTKIIGPPVTELAEYGTRLPINGFSSSQASLSPIEATAQHSQHYDEENHNDHNMSDNRSMDIIEEGELPSEAYLEIPVVTEINSVPTDSKISLDVQYAESSLGTTQSTEGKQDITTGKQPARKSGRINRRSRGRGK